MVVDQRIRIMHVVRSLEVGGIENGVVNLLNRLSGEEFDHVVCCLTRAGKLVDRIESKNIEVVEVGLKSGRFRFPVLPLRRCIRRFAPDVLHTRGWSTVDAIFAARIAGVAGVIHGEHGREAADPEGLNRKRNLIRKVLSPMVDRFVTVSDDLRLWLTKVVGVPAVKVATIHNGVDTQKFSPAGRAPARRRLGLDDSTLAIGTVGRLDPVKDHKSLLRAFAVLAQTGEPIRLIIVGAGAMQHEIETEIRKLRIGKTVQLLGERQDVAQVLKAIDVFTLTSIAEGISNTILEAMASGLPVVATRVGGNPELVEHGVNGQVAGAGDVPAIAVALESYLRDPVLRQAHGRAGRLLTEGKFSLERMAAQYGELYRSVAQGRTSARAV